MAFTLPPPDLTPDYTYSEGLDKQNTKLSIEHSLHYNRLPDIARYLYKKLCYGNPTQCQTEAKYLQIIYLATEITLVEKRTEYAETHTCPRN